MIPDQQQERRPHRAAFIIAAGLAGLAGLLLRDASGLTQDGGYAGVGPADIPRIVAYGLLLLAGLTVLSGLRGDMPRPPAQASAPVFWILGGLGLQLVLLQLVGFIIASAILFAMTARGFGQRPLWRSLAGGLVLTALIYGVFDRLLKLNLPAGPLELLIFGG